MGEYADLEIDRYTSGRKGIPLPKPRVYHSIPKHEIAHKQFVVIKTKWLSGFLCGGRINLLHCTNKEYL